MALAQDEADTTRPSRLRKAAEALLGAAAAGDISAIKELGDRLDGKVAQAMTISADITTRNASELSDDQLAEIAAHASSRTQT